MTAPAAYPVVAAAHLGVLATLSMGVLGALHQFTPVVTHRPLRSALLARATFLAWLASSWLLPLGVAARQEGAVEADGALAAVAVTLLTVKLWAPLPARRVRGIAAGARRRRRRAPGIGRHRAGGEPGGRASPDAAAAGTGIGYGTRAVHSLDVNLVLASSRAARNSPAARPPRVSPCRRQK